MTLKLKAAAAALLDQRKRGREKGESQMNPHCGTRENVETLQHLYTAVQLCYSCNILYFINSSSSMRKRGGAYVCIMVVVQDETVDLIAEIIIRLDPLFNFSLST